MYAPNERPTTTDQPLCCRRLSSSTRMRRASSPYIALGGGASKTSAQINLIVSRSFESSAGGGGRGGGGHREIMELLRLPRSATLSHRKHMHSSPKWQPSSIMRGEAGRFQVILLNGLAGQDCKTKKERERRYRLPAMHELMLNRVTTYPYVADAVGYIVYSADGVVSYQLSDFSTEARSFDPLAAAAAVAVAA
jgi:hypothetical protein